MENLNTTPSYLTGQLLIAMPQIPDPRFARSVIYVCGHDSNGAIGLIINKVIPSLTFKDLINQLSLEVQVIQEDVLIHFGGPVELGRGFVLHSSDYCHPTTVKVNDDLYLTATTDVLKAIASGHGPEFYLLALGYVGWSSGQLESEIQANGWLTAHADLNLIFHDDLDGKWEHAMAKLGISHGTLAAEAGHA